jgi:hypothetical protein
MLNATVYQLWHYKIGPEDDFDDVDEGSKIIGIYSTEANAKAAIERLKSKPGFRDWPGGFCIFDYWLDHDGWTEGFINPYDDDDWPRPSKEEC